MLWLYNMLSSMAFKIKFGHEPEFTQLLDTRSNELIKTQRWWFSRVERSAKHFSWLLQLMLCLRIFLRHHIYIYNYIYIHIYVYMLLNTNINPRPQILKRWRYCQFSIDAPKRAPNQWMFIGPFCNAILLSLQDRHIFNSVDHPQSETSW